MYSYGQNADHPVAVFFFFLKKGGGSSAQVNMFSFFLKKKENVCNTLFFYFEGGEPFHFDSEEEQQMQDPLGTAKSLAMPMILLIYLYGERGSYSSLLTSTLDYCSDDHEQVMACLRLRTCRKLNAFYACLS